MVALIAVVFALLIPVSLLLLVKRMRSERQRRAQVQWLQNQVARALDQLTSTSNDEVLVGLQTIALISDREGRMAARPAVERLTKSADERVSRQAVATLARLNTETTEIS